MAQSPRRSARRAKPSFEVPSDVTAATESGWVFRSDAHAKSAAAPKAVAPKAVGPKAAAPKAAASKAAASPPAAPKPAAPPPAAQTVAAPAAARSLPAPGPLRFAWMPLAIAYSTILAMLPQRGRAHGSHE